MEPDTAPDQVLYPYRLGDGPQLTVSNEAYQFIRSITNRMFLQDQLHSLLQKYPQWKPYTESQWLIFADFLEDQSEPACETIRNLLLP